jgi:hypothetical protein
VAHAEFVPDRSRSGNDVFVTLRQPRDYLSLVSDNAELATV